MPESTAVALRPEEQRLATITQQLEARESDLLAVLPESMSVERFMRVSLLAVSKNKDLLSCSPGSIIRSVIEAAEIGLEPTGSLNRAWLLPYTNDGVKEAQLMIGYQGYADLMRDSGKVTRISAEVVFEGDTFRVVKGSEEPRIIHTPRYKTEDPTKITYVYGIAWFADGTQQFEVMTRAQVEAIRTKSKQRNGPTWTQNWPQMARKTVIRRLANYVPLTARAATAIARDDEREYGEPTATVVGERANRVRDRIKATRGQPSAQNPAPGGSEAQTSTPAETADQRTDDAVVVEGESREVEQTVCGDRFVPPSGPVRTCELEPGHYPGTDHKGGPVRWKGQA